VLISTFGDEYKVPVTYNFNLTFEREVTTGLMARAAYVGSRNRNGRFTQQLNPAVYAIGATTGTTDARRLFANDKIGGVDNQVQDRKSTYNSMQLTLSKRYSKGYTITSNYTLSKVEGNFGDEIIPWNETQPAERDPLVWGLLNQDRRHRFTTSWVMELPGQSIQSPLRWVIGGWQWTGVMQFQTGAPFTIVSGSDNSRRGLGRSNRRPGLIARSGSMQRRSLRTTSGPSAMFPKVILPVRRCTAGTWGSSRTSR
jgi:hypothetical protein